MNTADMAWSKIKDVMNDVEAETAYELEKLYVFSVRPSETPSGFSTGSVVITVDKRTGKIEGVMGDDSKLRKGSYFKMLDSELFK